MFTPWKWHPIRLNRQRAFCDRLFNWFLRAFLHSWSVNFRLPILCGETKDNECITFNGTVLCSSLILEGIDNPKMKIQSLITHPHVVPNELDLRSSLELRYSSQMKIFLMKSEIILTLHIYSNATDTSRAQKGCKDIVKIVHVTSVVQP